MMERTYHPHTLGHSLGAVEVRRSADRPGRARVLGTVIIVQVENLVAIQVRYKGDLAILLGRIAGRQSAVSGFSTS
jgi:hypothetical protein